MTTTLASPPEEKTGSNSNPQQMSRALRAGPQPEDSMGMRFFLRKGNVNAGRLRLGRELLSEGEARVEALKAGVTYHTVQEWRPVPDFAGKNPELKREAVLRKNAE